MGLKSFLFWAFCFFGDKHNKGIINISQGGFVSKEVLGNFNYIQAYYFTHALEKSCQIAIRTWGFKGLHLKNRIFNFTSEGTEIKFSLASSEMIGQVTFLVMLRSFTPDEVKIVVRLLHNSFPISSLLDNQDPSSFFNFSILLYFLS